MRGSLLLDYTVGDCLLAAFPWAVLELAATGDAAAVRDLLLPMAPLLSDAMAQMQQGCATQILQHDEVLWLHFSSTSLLAHTCIPAASEDIVG
jgi:hypothetical protein